jgi:hypothetical protein
MSRTVNSYLHSHGLSSKSQSPNYVGNKRTKSMLYLSSNAWFQEQLIRSLSNNQTIHNSKILAFVKITTIKFLWTSYKQVTNRSFSRSTPPLRCLAKSPKSAHAHYIGWLVNEDNFERALSLQNGPHLPTTQCACADFEYFAEKRNGGGGREKDL